MDLAAIRQGIADVLDNIPGCRVYATIPEGLAASGTTALVIAPSDPYVTYSEAAGLANRNEVRMRIVVVPAQQAGATRVLDEIDALLSCGTSQPRSVRTLLGDNISAGGTACSVSALTASIRTVDINDVSHVVGEIDLRILARC
jgi:hypothetical protein